MDLDHLEHAGFDPEAAAFEDGMDPEDLGYDEEEEDEEDFAGENCLRHWFLIKPMFSCTLMAAFEDGMDRTTWGTTRRKEVDEAEEDVTAETLLQKTTSDETSKPGMNQDAALHGSGGAGIWSMKRRRNTLQVHGILIETPLILE